MNSFWSFVGFLVQQAYDFMCVEISCGSTSFTLWEMAIGFAVLSIVAYAIARCLD